MSCAVSYRVRSSPVAAVVEQLCGIRGGIIGCPGLRISRAGLYVVVVGVGESVRHSDTIPCTFLTANAGEVTVPLRL